MDPKIQLITFKLQQVVTLLSAAKKEDDLTKDDRIVLSTAIAYFGDQYSINNYQSFLKKLPVSAVVKYINELEKEGAEKESKAAEVEKPKEQESSIPPELESMVAEYHHNQALLEDEEIKSNNQKSVAEQVKIAIAHSKIKELALANKQSRIQKGEVFNNADDVLVDLGSPKSDSKTAALAISYKVVQEVANNNESFKSLSPIIQSRIINEAVDLNVISVTNIDVAIQSAALLIDHSDLSPGEQNKLSAVSSNYIHSVYDAVNTQTKQSATYQSQIDENEVMLLRLKNEANNLSGKELEIKTLQIKSLSETNQQLSTKIDNLPQQLKVFINNQSVDFQKFERESLNRLSQDPDIKDKIDLSNKNNTSLIENLERGGVVGQIYSNMDKGPLLEEVIRHDLPGTLNSHAGFEAERAAAIINDSKTQDPNLSPQAVLLYGKGVKPEVLALARQYALDHPDSQIGKLYSANGKLFELASNQIRKIDNSFLGKQINIVKTNALQRVIPKFYDFTSKQFDKFNNSFIGKRFANIKNGLYKTVGSITKLTDKIPGRLGGVLRYIKDPVGALKSWAGRKAGQYILRQLRDRVANKVLSKTAEMVLKDGVKEAAKKLLAKLAVKVAAKIGVELAISSTGVGIIVAIAMEIISWIYDKIKAFVKQAGVAIYGEEVKSHDYLAASAMAVSSIGGSIFSAIGGIGAATATAAGSAFGTITIGTIVGLIFYITSFAVAPLISTLVQLDSTQKTTYSGPILPGCPSTWPVSEGFIVNQGPGGRASHYSIGYDQGIDISTPVGTSIKSTTSGTVSFAGFSAEYLNTDIVIVDSVLEDGTEFKVVYAHLSNMDVSTGDTVGVDTPIGNTGTAGTGPHLHYEYKDIQYNQCPAGGIQLSENCSSNEIYPGPICSDSPQVYTN